MKIAVVGTGYVGLVTGTCFAETGNEVICIDIDDQKVKSLSGGEITIYEPGLNKLFPTPPGTDGSADLRFVLGVADQLGKLMKDYKVIIDKSTVPVGTAQKVRETIARNFKGEFDVVSNPEFLREGVAVDDFMKPDRVVIGTSSERARKVM